MQNNVVPAILSVAPAQGVVNGAGLPHAQPVLPTGTAGEGALDFAAFLQGVDTDGATQASPLSTQLKQAKGLAAQIAGTASASSEQVTAQALTGFPSEAPELTETQAAALAAISGAAAGVVNGVIATEEGPLSVPVRGVAVEPEAEETAVLGALNSVKAENTKATVAQTLPTQTPPGAATTAQQMQERQARLPGTKPQTIQAPSTDAQPADVEAASAALLRNVSSLGKGAAQSPASAHGMPNTQPNQTVTEQSDAPPATAQSTVPLAVSKAQLKGTVAATPLPVSASTLPQAAAPQALTATRVQAIATTAVQRQELSPDGRMVSAEQSALGKQVADIVTAKARASTPSTTIAPSPTKSAGTGNTVERLVMTQTAHTEGAATPNVAASGKQIDATTVTQSAGAGTVETAKQLRPDGTPRAAVLQAETVDKPVPAAPEAKASSAALPQSHSQLQSQQKQVAPTGLENTAPPAAPTRVSGTTPPVSATNDVAKPAARPAEATPLETAAYDTTKVQPDLKTELKAELKPGVTQAASAPMQPTAQAPAQAAMAGAEASSQQQAVQAMAQANVSATAEAAQPQATSQPAPMARSLMMTDREWPTQLTAMIKEARDLTQGDIEIALQPERLGRMTIRMEMRDNQVSVSILTDNDASARLLNDNQGKLADLMTKAGLDLTQHNASSGQQGREQAGLGQNAGGNSGNGQGQSGDDAQLSTAQILGSETANLNEDADDSGIDILA